MKIAFVGKGGSGKSTISSFFVTHLVNSAQKIMAVDADINQHFAQLVGARFDAAKALSANENKTQIRTHLIGDNPRIVSPKHMIKTTPPGRGSMIVELTASDHLLDRYATKFGDNAYFLHVGTYQKDEVGMSCYHTSLSVFENVLSHTPASADDEWVVVDMVAGTDAFSGPLHAMFDAIFIVVEPTVESTSVYKQFIDLATSSNVQDRVKIIANKVEDDDDVAYIRSQAGSDPVAVVSYDTTFRRQRRDGGRLSETSEVASTMSLIDAVARRMTLPADDHLSKLHDLHTIFAQQKFTVDKYGNTTGHIDTDFSFTAKNT
ncbi:MAG: ATP-binding protein [Chloroflexi bacterium]|nr:MAG: ATP-binding protein [Chloroflexota bacterium]